MSAVCAACGGTGREPEPGRLVVDTVVPVRTVSEANIGSSRREKMRRKKAQRLMTAAWLLGHGGVPSQRLLDKGVVVELTRIAPRMLDAHDNLPAALKHVTDGIADWLGVDDRDERVTWLQPKQERGAPGQYAVRVVVRERRTT